MKLNKKNAAFVLTVAISIVTILIYYPALNAPFVLDDQSTIIESKYMHQPDRLLDLSPTAHVIQRSFARFTLWITKTTSSQKPLSPRPFHITDLGIHLLTGLLVFFLCRKLVQVSTWKEHSPNAVRWLPIIAMAVFMLHPMQTQAVNYATQRMAQLEVLFNTIALISYIEFRVSKRGKAFKFMMILAFSLCALLALLSKATALTIPLQLIALEYIIIPRSKQQKPILFAWLAITSLGLIVGLVMPQSVADTPRISRWDYLLSQPWVVLNYIRLIFFPVGQSFDHVIAMWHEMGFHVLALSFSVHVLILVGAAVISKKRPLLAFGIWFFYLSLSIESSVIPLKDLMVEHRLYLPFIGFSIVVADLISTLRPRYMAVVFVSVITGLSLLTWHRCKDWKNEWTLWNSVLSVYPTSDFALTELANQLLAQQDSALAEIYLDSALRLDPTNVTALNSRALMFIEQGQYYNAVGRLNRIYHLEPYYWPAMLNHGYLEERYQNNKEAEKWYRKAAAYCHGCGEPHVFLGTLFLNQGQLKKAEIQFQLADEKGFSSARLYNNHGYLRLLEKDTVSAIAYFSKSLALDPKYVNPMMSLGKISLARKDSLTAQYHFLNIISTEPTNPEARKFVSLLENE